MIAINASVSAGNFVFLVMVARTFAPRLFGAFAALSALLLLYEVPASAMQALVARAMASPTVPAEGASPGGPLTLAVPGSIWGGGRGRHSAGDAGPLVVDALIVGAAVCAVVVAATPIVDALWHLHGFALTVLLGVDAVPVAVALVPKGILLGTGRLRALAAALGAGMVTKVAVGVVLVHGGGGLDGALAAVVAGELVSAAALLAATRRDLRSKRRARRSTEPVPLISVRWRQGLPVAASFTGYWLLAGTDLLVARHWLTATSAGAYAAAATAAQLAMWVPAMVASSSLPRAASDRLAAARWWPSARQHRSAAVVAAMVAGAALSAGIALGARPLVLALFDRSYGPAAGVVGLVTVATALFAVTTVAVTPKLARGDAVPVWLPWAGVAALVASTAIWHAGPLDVAWSALGANAGVCAALGALSLHRLLRRRREETAGEPPRLDPAAAELDLTLVVPYYNPGALLRANLEATLEVLAGTGATFEVVAVSDGSTDGSDRSIEAITDAHLQRVTLAANQGKGAALAAGLVLGRGRYLGFIDADGDLDPALLAAFVDLARLHEPDVVLGSKRHPLSSVEYPPLRRVYSKGYQLLVRAMFRLDLRDTQTGLKLVRRDVLAAALPRMVEKRFAWDLELFVVARHLGYRRFLEAPVRLRHRFTSTVSWRSVWRTFADTLAIFYRLRALRWYDEDHRELSARDGDLRIVPVVLRPGAGPSAPGWGPAPWAPPVVRSEPA